MLDGGGVRTRGVAEELDAKPLARSRIRRLWTEVKCRLSWSCQSDRLFTTCSIHLRTVLRIGEGITPTARCSYRKRWRCRDSKKRSLFGASGGSRQSISVDPWMARLPFLDIHRWPDDGGPSTEPAIPCLHKGHILGSIRSVAVFFFFLRTFAHTHSATQVDPQGHSGSGEWLDPNACPAGLPAGQVCTEVARETAEWREPGRNT